MALACFGRTTRLIAVAFLLALTATARAEPAGAPRIDLTDYDVTFEEKFDTLDISASGPNTRWTAHTPWHGDFGDARFDDPGPNGPFSRDASGLKITARKDAQGQWHSGLICSVDRDRPDQHGFSQQFGYFEMRAKLPDGPGVWPAFWLIGVDKQHAGSEIDIFEYYGAFPNYFNIWMHVFKDNRDALGAHKIVHVSKSMTDDYNSYGVSIEPDRTRFYFNREEVWSQATPSDYHQPMYILVDLAIGGGWPYDKLTTPQEMLVRDIVVYQTRQRLAGARPPGPEHSTDHTNKPSQP